MMPEFSCNATLDSIAAFKLLKKFIKLCHMISFQIIQSLDVRKYKSDLPPDSLLSLSLYLSISVKISVIPVISVCLSSSCYVLLSMSQDLTFLTYILLTADLSIYQLFLEREIENDWWRCMTG